MKPILFNTEMVRAILDGRKTTTRRPIKNAPLYSGRWGFTMFTPKGHISFRRNDAGSPSTEQFFKMPCQVGDIIYVRETWLEDGGKYFYRTDFEDGMLDCCETLHGGYPSDCRNHPGCHGCQRERTKLKWHPSIHMPKSAARIFLRVTDVRAERVQDITEDGALKEGIREFTKDGKLFKYSVTDDFIWQDAPKTTREAFNGLWNGIYEKQGLGWGANPWVWVIEFEVKEV